MGRFSYNTKYEVMDDQNICHLQAKATLAAEREILQHTNEGDGLLEMIMLFISKDLDAMADAYPFSPQDPHLYVLFDIEPKWQGIPLPFMFGVQITKEFGRQYITTEVSGTLMTVEEGRQKAAEIRGQKGNIVFDGKMN